MLHIVSRQSPFPSHLISLSNTRFNARNHPQYHPPTRNNSGLCGHSLPTHARCSASRRASGEKGAAAMYYYCNANSAICRCRYARATSAGVHIEHPSRSSAEIGGCSSAWHPFSIYSRADGTAHVEGVTCVHCDKGEKGGVRGRGTTLASLSPSACCSCRSAARLLVSP
jgi:hypothetical protein